MPAAKKWQIWSKGGDGKWDVVATGFDQRDARLEASRRNAAARRVRDENAQFRAMPVGVVPYYDTKEKR
jgi:hypothetical protein